MSNRYSLHPLPLRPLFTPSLRCPVPSTLTYYLQEVMGEGAHLHTSGRVQSLVNQASRVALCDRSIRMPFQPMEKDRFSWCSLIIDSLS